MNLYSPLQWCEKLNLPFPCQVRVPLKLHPPPPPQKKRRSLQYLRRTFVNGFQRNLFFLSFAVSISSVYLPTHHSRKCRRNFCSLSMRAAKGLVLREGWIYSKMIASVYAAGHEKNAFFGQEGATRRRCFVLLQMFGHQE